MSTYKVIQDVEAEDKLIGPLSLRQFIYAAIAAICFYSSYFAATHGAAFLLSFLLPVGFVATFFAFPWGRDQPTEIWALAKIRFYFKPRKRIWDQSGVKQLVTITAPRQVHLDYTNGLSQNEVHSRLRALADTIDSRGWVIKNSNVNYYQPPIVAEPTSDRLINGSALPQPISDVRAADDIMDETNNPDAQRMDSMIAAADKAHRQKIITNLQQPKAQVPRPPIDPLTEDQRRQANYWFLNQPMTPAAIPANQVTFNTQVVTPGMDQSEMPTSIAPATPTPDEQSLVAKLKTKKSELPTNAYYGHLHTVQPLSAQNQMQQQNPPLAQPTGQPSSNNMVLLTPTSTPSQPQPQAAGQPPMTPAVQAAILQLSKNDDLNVATIAREAERASQDEVVIKLH